MKTLVSALVVLSIVILPLSDAFAANKADIKIQFKNIRLDPGSPSKKTKCPIRVIPSKPGSNGSSGDGSDNMICKRGNLYESDLACISAELNVDEITFKAIGGGINYKITNKAMTGSPSFMTCAAQSGANIVCTVTQASNSPRGYTIITEPTNGDPVCALDPRIIITNENVLDD